MRSRNKHVRSTSISRQYNEPRNLLSTSITMVASCLEPRPALIGPDNTTALQRYGQFGSWKSAINSRVVLGTVFFYGSTRSDGIAK